MDTIMSVAAKWHADTMDRRVRHGESGIVPLDEWVDDGMYHCRVQHDGEGYLTELHAWLNERGAPKVSLWTDNGLDEGRVLITYGEYPGLYALTLATWCDYEGRKGNRPSEA